MNIIATKKEPISLDSELWSTADSVLVDRYWSGSPAPEARWFRAALLWSPSDLFVRFEANQQEPLVILDEPVLDRKTLNLWDRDVCEIFLAPDGSEPYRYFEFEVAPTGEWVDLAIDISSGERVTSVAYNSGMVVTTRIERETIVMAMRVPWSAFGVRPNAGDVWFGNIFRCVGSGDSRGYLAWRPTLTAKPSFHVPDKFGKFQFLDYLSEDSMA